MFVLCGNISKKSRNNGTLYLFSFEGIVLMLKSTKLCLPVGPEGSATQIMCSQVAHKSILSTEKQHTLKPKGQFHKTGGSVGEVRPSCRVLFIIFSEF